MTSQEIAAIVVHVCKTISPSHGDEIIGEVYLQVGRAVSRDPNNRANTAYILASAWKQAGRELRKRNNGCRRYAAKAKTNRPVELSLEDNVTNLQHYALNIKDPVLVQVNRGESVELIRRWRKNQTERDQIVLRVIAEEWSVNEAARAARKSPRTIRRWIDQWLDEKGCAMAARELLELRP